MTFKAYDRPRISFLNSWDAPPFFQDKVYQPLRQRISQTEIYCITPGEHCELNLYFCLFVFLVRDWSLQSQWQTAAKLMRQELQQPTEISRWGIMWPTMRAITRPSSFMNSFEARNFTLISHSGEGKNVSCEKCFIIFFFFFQSHDDFFFLSPRMLCPGWPIYLWLVLLVRQFPAPTPPPKTACLCSREWWTRQRAVSELWGQQPPRGPSPCWTWWNHRVRSFPPWVTHDAIYCRDLQWKHILNFSHKNAV